MQPSGQPAANPSLQPSLQPILHPTSQPTNQPVAHPTCRPTTTPSSHPTHQSVAHPTSQPSRQPTGQPFWQPLSRPSGQPSSFPSAQPSWQPTSAPSDGILSIVIRNSTNSKNSTTLDTIKAVEDLLNSVSNTFLRILNGSLAANGSVSVSTISFTSEFMKTSISVIALPPSFLCSNRTNDTTSVRILIPSSSNELDLVLSHDLGGANSLGAMVSVIELSTNMFGGSIGGTNTTESSSTALSGVSAPIVASDIVTISLVTVSRNLSLSHPILPTFDAKFELESPAPAKSNESTRLHHNCSICPPETVADYCSASHIWLNVTCTGRAIASVRRSCPVFRHVCAVLNLADNSVASTEYCQTIVAGTGSVLCRCGYDTSSNHNDSAALAALNGKVAVAALGIFYSSGLDASVLAVAHPIATNVATDSVLVSVAFGSMWVVGLLGIFGSYWSLQSTSKHHQVLPTLIFPVSITSSDIEVSSLRVRQLIDATWAYLSLIAPPSLQTNRWWLSRIGDILLAKHKCLNLLAKIAGIRVSDVVNESLERQQRRELLNIIYVVTALTISCFIMAFFYDMQSPVDDGYCGQLLDREACRLPKTALDPHINRCIWIKPPVALTAAVVVQSSALNDQVISTSTITFEVAEEDDAFTVIPCQLNANTLSSRVYLLAFFITSLSGMLLMSLLDKLFDILHAQYPSEDAIPSKKRTSEAYSTGEPSLLSVVPFESAPSAFASSVGNEKIMEERIIPELLITRSLTYARLSWRRALQQYGRFSTSATKLSADQIDSEREILQLQVIENHVAGISLLLQLILDVNIQKGQDCSAYEAQLLHHVLQKWYPEKDWVSSANWQYAMWIVLLLIHAGALYFLLAKAAIRGFAWQIAFFSSGRVGGTRRFVFHSNFRNDSSRVYHSNDVTFGSNEASGRNAVTGRCRNAASNPGNPRIGSRNSIFSIIGGVVALAHFILVLTRSGHCPGDDSKIPGVDRPTTV